MATFWAKLAYVLFNHLVTLIAFQKQRINEFRQTNFRAHSYLMQPGQIFHWKDFFAKSKSPPTRKVELGTCNQCDKMLKLKVAQIIPKVAQKVAQAVFYLKSNVLIAQKVTCIWATFVIKFVTNNFQKSPNWSHYLQLLLSSIRQTKYYIYFSNSFCLCHILSICISCLCQCDQIVN